jgi:aminocarboxymuconate-semialdehyde decarboxylase
MLKIDMHTHILPKELPRWAQRFGYGDFIHLEHHRPGFARMMQGDRFFREINENCWNAGLRIQEYERFNTQVQVVCTVPVMFSYWARPDDGHEVAKFLNDDLADLVARYPKNYVGLGTLPLQDTALSIKELERCKAIGLRGIQIGSNIEDRNLSDPAFFPVFEACEALDMCIMVHPWNMMGKKHMEKYWLPWLVGMPAETSRAICSMIFSGVLERLPRLRVNFSHASGSFLATIGRVEHGFNCRPDLVAIDNPINPREYLGKFWVDSITHDARMLEYVLELVGSKRVCLGSDYPFPLGDLEIGAFIETMNAPNEVVEDIFCNATLEWLGMSAADFL